MDELKKLIAENQLDETSHIANSFNEFLIGEELATNESPATLDSISYSARLSRPQKIDVFELVGTVYILKKDCDFKSLNLRCAFWCEAQSLRRGDGRNPIPKIQLNLSECARKVFGNTSEFSTDDELEHIFDNPFDNLGLIRSEYHLQTLLMIQRILSQIHVDPLPFFLHRLFTFGHSVSGSSFNKQKTIERWTFYSFPAIRTKK